MKRATQSDVARRSGVSRATVYYVLSSQAGGKVSISEETRRRVLDAVAELNYEPDVRAQALRSGETKRIGLLIPDNTNPFYWQRIIGIEQAARERGYDIMLSTTSLSDEQEAYSLKALSSRRVDGIIVTLAFIEQSESLLDLVTERQLPMVLLQPTDREIDAVVVNNEDGMARVVSHLIELGHRRIGLIYGLGAQSPSMDGMRLQAYRDGLIGAGLQVDETLIDWCGTTAEEGHQAALRLLNRAPRPTALIALNDLLALGAMRAAAGKGLWIPDDLSIVGFDDIPLAQHFVPPLTTVGYDAGLVGRSAVDLLLKRLQDPARPAEKVMTPVRFVVRESTGWVNGLA